MKYLLIVLEMGTYVYQTNHLLSPDFTQQVSIIRASFSERSCCLCYSVDHSNINISLIAIIDYARIFGSTMGLYFLIEMLYFGLAR